MKSLHRLALVLGLAALPFALCSAALADSACGAVGGNLVSNCSFETGDFTGWAVGNTGNQPTVTTSNPADGSYAAQLGSVNGGNSNMISTTINTVAGDMYQLTFDLENVDNGTTPNGEMFEVEAVYPGSGPAGILPSQQIAESSAYATYTSELFYGDGDLTLQFIDYNGNSVFDLDNVSVTDLSAGNAATPEPSSLALLGTGSLAFGEVLRRKLKRS